ncbi:MAG: hypothetical protein ACXIUM_06385 [Wenzhouxiangella sp.]
MQPGLNARTRRLKVRLALGGAVAQMIEQIHAGDQPQEAIVVHDDGNMVAVENRQQFINCCEMS